MKIASRGVFPTLPNTSIRRKTKTSKSHHTQSKPPAPVSEQDRIKLKFLNVQRTNYKANTMKAVPSSAMGMAKAALPLSKELVRTSGFFGGILGILTAPIQLKYAILRPAKGVHNILIKVGHTVSAMATLAASSTLIHAGVTASENILKIGSSMIAGVSLLSAFINLGIELPYNLIKASTYRNELKNLSTTGDNLKIEEYKRELKEKIKIANQKALAYTLRGLGNLCLGTSVLFPPSAPALIPVGALLIIVGSVKRVKVSSKEKKAIKQKNQKTPLEASKVPNKEIKNSPKPPIQKNQNYGIKPTSELFPSTAPTAHRNVKPLNMRGENLGITGRRSRKKSVHSIIDKLNKKYKLELEKKPAVVAKKISQLFDKEHNFHKRNEDDFVQIIADLAGETVNKFKEKYLNRDGCLKSGKSKRDLQNAIFSNLKRSLT